jgi:heme-degrading monooxygenase HmoA
MFVALWEFEVKPGCEERFEKVYGPEGAWARLFGRHPHYHETRLVRDSFRQNVYLTMDFWSSRQSYETFMEEHKVEYQAIDTEGEELAVSERKIDWYERVQP